MKHGAKSIKGNRKEKQVEFNSKEKSLSLASKAAFQLFESFPSLFGLTAPTINIGFNPVLLNRVRWADRQGCLLFLAHFRAENTSPPTEDAFLVDEAVWRQTYTQVTVLLWTKPAGREGAHLLLVPWFISCCFFELRQWPPDSCGRSSSVNLCRVFHPIFLRSFSTIHSLFLFIYMHSDRNYYDYLHVYFDLHVCTHSKKELEMTGMEKRLLLFWLEKRNVYCEWSHYFGYHCEDSGTDLRL